MGVWAINRTINRLAEVLEDEQHYMVFAPNPEEKGENPTPLVVYTTAKLTQEISEKFSKTGYGYYYPTEYRSSNARDARPTMITPYRQNSDLVVEVRQIDIPQRKQEITLGCSFSNFVYGSETANIFKLFPPDQYRRDGVDTTLIAVNPQSPKLEKETKTLAS